MKTLRNSVIVVALVLPAGLAMASNQNGTAADVWWEQTNPSAPNYTYYSSSGFYPYTGSSIANANMTAGGGPLDTIGGTNTRTMAALDHNSAVNMYCVTVTNPATFSVTCNTAPSHADLYLFNAAGVAIAGYQSLSTGGVAGNPATLAAGVAVGAFNAGDLAYIAITRDASAIFTNHPLNAEGQSIFPNVVGAVLPDPTITDYVLNPTENIGVNWQNNDGGGQGAYFTQAYTLTLTGAGYSTTPTPGAGAILGLGGLVALRRRR